MGRFRRARGVTGACSGAGRRLLGARLGGALRGALGAGPAAAGARLGVWRGALLRAAMAVIHTGLETA